MSSKGITPIGLIPPNQIEFDTKNPRGEKEEQIEEDQSFIDLRKSVKNQGVLVPLITRNVKNKAKPYKLVDGERRLRAAIKENLPLVPVHILQGDETDGRILAYQIHMLREQWTKENEVSSIKEIIKEVRDENIKITESELYNKLKGFTYHKDHELKDLLRLAKYDDATIAKLQSGEILLSHLIHIDASFISPLQREFPKIYGEYGDKNLRNIMVKKAEEGLLGNTRYLMDEILKYFSDSSDGKYIFSENKVKLGRFIKKFLRGPTLHVSFIAEKMEVQPKAKKERAKRKKTKEKSDSKEKDSAGESEKFSYTSINITKKNIKKINDIESMFNKIVRSFSKEEIEYVKEAIYCLKDHCFKAAVLMIWATGISRILKHVGKNLIEFNKLSKEMADKPKSFYKYFSGNFQKSATDVNDIRENSNDMQLLCYICHKNFVDVTQFKKLKHNYETRCDCAHPTDITLSPNEIISIFENVYDLILNNARIG